MGGTQTDRQAETLTSEGQKGKGKFGAEQGEKREKYLMRLRTRGREIETEDVDRAEDRKERGRGGEGARQ